MHFTQALALASTAVLVAAAPAIKLEADDVILYSNDGRYAKMKRSDLAELEALRNSNTAPPKPSSLETTLTTFTGNDTLPSTDAAPAQKRGGSVSLVIPGPDSRFLGWDVLSSQVVKGAPTTVSITQGISLANSISVGVTTTLQIVKDFLGASLNINYSETWTTSQTQAFTAEVPVGKYGALVTNAWTNRKSGNVWEGSIGGDGSLAPYQADSFEARSYGDMKWVDGVISLCTGDEFPLKRCLGEGTL
jgi:hypothetical protein